MDKNIQKIKPSGIFTNYIYKAIPLAFDESMSYYETLCGILSLLKTQEEVVNNNADLLAELELYVQNYFKNLDVQTEINNKLDEMAESGQLADIIAQYLQVSSILAFNTVENMKKSTNLTEGSYAETYGFNTIGDGGSAKYKIRKILNTDNIDNLFLFGLTNDNTLVAELIYGSEININQFGASNIEDCSILVNKLIENPKINIINFEKMKYNFNTTININKTIKLNFNNAVCMFTGDNYMFNITTNFSNKPSLNNLIVYGTDTNGLINAEIKSTWGCSYDLINSIIYKFKNIITAKNIFNCRHINTQFSSDNGIFTINADDMSNNIIFTNCYIKGYNLNKNVYPDYKFNLTKVKNLKFISCAFEQYNTLFNLSSCDKIVLSNCESEQQTNISNTSDGLSIDNSNILINLTKFATSDTYLKTPRRGLQPHYFNVGESTSYTLRSKILKDTSITDDAISFVENSNGNSCELYRLSDKDWKLFIPFNIVSNKGENLTELTTSLYTIFSEQQEETTLITAYIECVGSDGGRMIFKSEYFFETNTSIRKIKQEKIIDTTWSGSAINGLTLTETINQNNYKIIADKTCDNIGVKVKFEKLGDKIY